MRLHSSVPHEPALPYEQHHPSEQQNAVRVDQAGSIEPVHDHWQKIAACEAC
jgi:hypothetical protein